ncbi:substrate-binding domain-containing protein [Brevundimonas albigilva]|uniref:PstS family phosphate ABC transporter substrate-binding protein n=1 Tax=Brevundimonas albigilva TaxID=1312364 RepID=UPI00201B4C5D|nr:substrate-binding domain-containing protein [Brevundimonas albigilva]UQV18953.1 substrate-binding domain-containing protein [Brevundimonas albigilva]
MRFIALLLAAFSLATTAAAQAGQVYQPVPGLTGTVTSIGSRSGTEVLARWATRFMELNPGVRVEAVGSGSGTAFPALIEGRSDMAPMSRPMTAGMIDEFTKTRGYPPLSFRIGIGGVAVFVHPSNPIAGLTRAQLDGLYSNTYFMSERAILTWGDAGLSGDWSGRRVTLYATPEGGGAWGLLRAEASTMSGQMKPSIVQLPTPAEVVAAVAGDPNGIGFAPAGLDDSRVRILPIASGIADGAGYVGYEKTAEAERRASEFIAPTPQELAAETYPLTRYFRLYIDQDPNEPMPEALKEFLRYAMSDEAQAMMTEAGYVPLPADVVAEQLASLR